VEHVSMARDGVIYFSYRKTSRHPDPQQHPVGLSWWSVVEPPKGRNLAARCRSNLETASSTTVGWSPSLPRNAHETATRAPRTAALNPAVIRSRLSRWSCPAPSDTPI
jgi:hypothetical protein